MPTFTYKAMDAHDRFITGEIEAADPREVSRELEKLGYVVLDTETGMRGATSKSTLLRLFHRPAGRREMTVFLRELSLVLRAGLTLDDALLLLAGEEKAGLAAIVRDLRVTITGGASFGDALQRHPRLFGPDLVAMVRVAEASGNLDGVLESVGEERARTERLLDKISSALRYPAVLLVVALSVLTFFLVVVVPQFASVLRDFGQAPSGLVGVVLATSDFFVAYGLWVAGILVALAALFVLIMLRPRPRAVVVGYISRLPGLRGILELRRTVLFCSSLGTLLANGVTLTAALRVLVDLPGASSRRTRSRGRRRAARRPVGGRSLAHWLYSSARAEDAARGRRIGGTRYRARRTAEYYEFKLFGPSRSACRRGGADRHRCHRRHRWNTHRLNAFRRF